MKLPPIPDPLRRLLAWLPQYPASAAFAAALTLWLGETLGADAHPELTGKLIRLHVTDAGVTLTLRVMPRGFAPGTGNPDLTLAAAAEDLLVLALRREDPDTLFFSRLVMEGDTELGLLGEKHARRARVQAVAARAARRVASAALPPALTAAPADPLCDTRIVSRRHHTSAGMVHRRI